MMTRSTGEYFFCADCHNDIVYPLVNIAVATLVESVGGDGYKGDREKLAESLRPGSEHRIVVGFARIGAVDGNASGRIRAAQQDTDNEGKSEDRKPEGEDQEAPET